MKDFYELLKLVNPKWQESLKKFVMYGEATSQFIDFLENDKDCQNAVNVAFEIQSKKMEELVKKIHDITNMKAFVK